MKYKANKTDKARTIVCAFYNLPDLPRGDDRRVRQWRITKQGHSNWEDYHSARRKLPKKTELLSFVK